MRRAYRRTLLQSIQLRTRSGTRRIQGNRRPALSLHGPDATNRKGAGSVAGTHRDWLLPRRHLLHDASVLCSRRDDTGPQATGGKSRDSDFVQHARARVGPLHGWDTWPHISQALARLFAVSVFVKPASVVNWHRYSAGHLLDALTTDMTGDTIAVSLSPALASAVLGGRGEFIRVPMEEVRELRTDRSGIARLLHFHLHGLPAGETCRITEGRLMSLIFGSDAVQGSTLRMRTSALRKAMVWLGLLPGWKTSRNGATHYVRRPKSVRSSRQVAEH
jgi:hypothetical protein